MQRKEKDKDFDKRKIPRQKTSTKADSDGSISFDNDDRHIKLPDIRYSDISTESLYEKSDYAIDQSKRHVQTNNRNKNVNNYNDAKHSSIGGYRATETQKNVNINQLQYHEYSKANKEKIEESYQKREGTHINEINRDTLKHTYYAENAHLTDEDSYRLRFYDNYNLRTNYKTEEESNNNPKKTDKSMHKKEKKRKICNNEKEDENAEKSLQDYFFEIINEEAKLLKLHPYFYSDILNLKDEVNDDVYTKNETLNTKNYFTDYNIAESSNDQIQDENKKRGRPRSRSIEYPLSEYDENGMRIDPATSAIDFRDELFVDPDNPGGKSFVCPKRPKCKKTFPSLSRAKRHFIVHLGIKPFKCENQNCPKTFSRRDNMLQHYHKHCSATKKQNKGANDEAVE